MMFERMKNEFESFKDDVDELWTAKADRNDLFMIIRAEEKLWSFEENEHELWLFVREEVQVSSSFFINVQSFWKINRVSVLWDRNTSLETLQKTFKDF